jgi:hypothetical protein
MPSRDYNFSLDGLDFGIGQAITVEEFDPGSFDLRTQDADNPVGDGKLFGRDWFGPPTWTFGLSVDASDDASALATLSSLAKVWRGDGVRGTPGSVLPLTYQLAGRQRRVYGRPRKWAAPPTNRMLQGYIPVTCDFALADTGIYDETQFSQIVSIVPATPGGFVTPLVAPISTLTGGQRSGFVTVTGDLPTWPTIQIRGPIVNPWVGVQGGWRLDFTTNVGANELIQVDPRPWVMSVTRTGGGSAAGTMSPKTRLSDIQIPTGTTEILFGGTDSTGTARCTVYWRPAWASL